MASYDYWCWAIRYYYHVDPTTLSDREFEKAIAYLELIRGQEAEAGVNHLHAALS